MRVDEEDVGTRDDLGEALERLIQIARDLFADLADGREPRLVAGSLLDAALSHLGWSAGLLVRVDLEQGSCEPVASRGEVRGATAPWAGDEGLLARVVQTAAVQTRTLDAGAAVAVPVTLGGLVIGVLGARTDAATEIPETVPAVLRGVAALCAPLVGRGPLPLGDGRSVDQILRAHKLESLGHLAGGVAHDFNNVLGVILGYVELAKMNMRETDPKVRRHLDLALSTLGRARTLADRLLDFSRAASGPSDLCDLNEAVQEVRELLSETLDRRIEFEVNLGTDLPPPPLDIDRLRQVVTNLCLNAAEAMPQGGRITVDTFRREVQPGGLPEVPPGVYCGLRVRDTGPGVPAEVRERIFQPYFTTRPGSSSGMGLWVVRGLVEQYDGRIEVGGDEHGAMFTVWLPSELRVWPRDASAAGAGDAGPEIVDVLVVDDEPGVRDITCAFLQIDGYSVLEAGTGAEALAILEARPGGVRVVFLDHLLPDVRGSELAWRIERMEGSPQVVMVTGLPAAASSEALPAGTRVLAKPYLHDDVSRLLRDDLGVLPRSAPEGLR